MRHLATCPSIWSKGRHLTQNCVQQYFALSAALVEFEQSLRRLLKREVPPEHGPKLASPQERQQRGSISAPVPVNSRREKSMLAARPQLFYSHGYIRAIKDLSSTRGHCSIQSRSRPWSILAVPGIA